MAKIQSKGGKAWERSRQIELMKRSEFEGGAVAKHAGWRAIQHDAAEIIPAQVENLRIEYDRTSNPAYVWEAISHLATRATWLGTGLDLPSWIAAYLARAATEIAWGAGGWASGDRTRPPSDAARKVWGASVSAGNMAARGLTADQRRAMVLETLGFKGSKGWQPLMTYYRAKAADSELRKVVAARSEGKTIREAMPEKADPHRALRRTRARHASVKRAPIGAK